MAFTVHCSCLHANTTTGHDDVRRTTMLVVNCLNTSLSLLVEVRKSCGQLAPRSIYLSRKPCSVAEQGRQVRKNRPSACLPACLPACLSLCLCDGSLVYLFAFAAMVRHRGSSSGFSPLGSDRSSRNISVFEENYSCSCCSSPCYRASRACYRSLTDSAFSCPSRCCFFPAKYTYVVGNLKG